QRREMSEVGAANERLDLVGKLHAAFPPWLSGLNSSSTVAIGRLLTLDRGIGSTAPLGPGAVVDRDVGSSERVEPEREDGGGDARPARRDNGLAEIEPRRLELPPEGVVSQERAVRLGQLIVWEVQAPGDVPGAKARARLGFGADEAPVRAGVEHLLAPLREIATNTREVADEAPAEARGEAARPRRRRARFDRPALGAPPREATIEDGDRVVAKGAEGPPHARGADDPARVVHDHAVAIADSQSPHAPGKFRGARQHVRERRTGVGD